MICLVSLPLLITLDLVILIVLTQVSNDGNGIDSRHGQLLVCLTRATMGLEADRLVIVLATHALPRRERYFRGGRDLVHRLLVTFTVITIVCESAVVEGHLPRGSL